MDLLSGKGFYIWQLPSCEDGDPEKLAEEIIKAGISHALVKIADGEVTYNVYKGIDMAPAAIKALKAVGITVWGWQYIYGYNPEDEAAIAIQRCVNLEVEGFVINAEVEYKHRNDRRWSI